MSYNPAYYPAGQLDARPKRSGSKALKIILGILVGILVLFMIAELALRYYISDQIKTSFADSVPAGAVVTDEPKVKYSAKPLLFGVATKKIDKVTVEVPSTLTSRGGVVEGNPAATMDLRGFTLTSEPVADQLTLTTDLPNQYVREILQSELSKAMNEAEGGELSIYNEIVTVSDVDSKPSNDSFEITFSNGALSVELQPHMENDQLFFTAVATRIVGIKLPDVVSEIITGALRSAMEEQVVGPLAVKDFKVLPDNFRITLSGSNVNLGELPVSG